MKIKAAVLAALLGLSVTPAGAQSRWMDEPAYYDGLPTRVIMRIVRQRGLTPISRPLRRGRHYMVGAVDPGGQMHRVIVDADSGGIVRIVAAPRRDFRYGGRYEDDGDVGLRRPPRVASVDPDYDDIRRPPAPVRRLPPLRPSIEDEDEYEASAPPPREGRRELPPLRPRGSVPDAPPVVTGEPQPLGALPPPPRPERERQAARTAPDVTPPAVQRAPAVRSGPPPTPRPRPQTAAATPAPESDPAIASTPEASANAEPPSTGSKRKGLPRVVLPGGPLPKAERTAETRPGQRISGEAPVTRTEEKPTGSTSAPAAPREAVPPVQPLD